MAVAMPEYLWVLVVGAIGAFVFGFGTGSNDVGNAFGTSVGSRTLTMKQAVIIAAIFELTGALVLGRVITETISGGIADINAFTRDPEFYAYGMMWALIVGGVWQILASHFELNVSATHSIVGAIIGFAMVKGGPDAVIWSQKVPRVPGERRPFPPVKGVVPIVLSWFFSPVLTGLASALIFTLCRVLVLRRQNAYRLSFVVLPLLVMLTIWINIYFVLTKGAAKTLKKDRSWTDHKAGWVAAIVAAGCSLISAVVVVPLLWRRIAQLERRAETKDAAAARQLEAADVPASACCESMQIGMPPPPPATGIAAWLRRLVRRIRGSKSLNSIHRAAMHGMEQDIHDIVETDELVAAIHANAEVFDPKAEQVFSYLQVFSAICVIFAHGAAEVGYMTGPLGAIWQVVNKGVLLKKVSSPLWVVLLSAFGLVFGLATYGYNVTRGVGTRMAKLTPSRGFAAELATSLVILVASQYGLPTSSSQCITGGVIGVALCEGMAGLNWRFFARTFSSWVSTLVVVAGVTALLFAQAVFAPSVPASSALRQYETGVSRAAGGVLAGYSDALRGSGYDTAAVAVDPFARSLAATRTGIAAVAAGRAPTVQPERVLGWLDTSLALVEPALALNYSAQHVCPAAAPPPGAAAGTYNPCTLPPTGDGSVQLTPLQYGVTTAELDGR